MTRQRRHIKDIFFLSILNNKIKQSKIPAEPNSAEKKTNFLFPSYMDMQVTDCNSSHVIC